MKNALSVRGLVTLTVVLGGLAGVVHAVPTTVQRDEAPASVDQSTAPGVDAPAIQQFTSPGTTSASDSDSDSDGPPLRPLGDAMVYNLVDIDTVLFSQSLEWDQSDMWATSQNPAGTVIPVAATIAKPQPPTVLPLHFKNDRHADYLRYIFNLPNFLATLFAFYLGLKYRRGTI